RTFLDTKSIKDNEVSHCADNVSLVPSPVFSGPWGRCMGSDCGLGGSQSRAVWCAHVDGWTTLHTNCEQAERPSNQRNCFHVCDWHRDLYGWRLGSWNQCAPVSGLAFGAPRLSSCSGGEEGLQTREVICELRADGLPAEDAICEYFEPKPRLEQYSPWTSCSKTCGTGLRNRVRSVLVPPLIGGTICPNLTEFQSCKLGACKGPEGLYSLRVGLWSSCNLPPLQPVRTARQVKHRKGKGSVPRERVGAKDPETKELIQKKRTRNRLNRQESPFWDVQVGYQTRNVTCIHRNGSTAVCAQRPPLTVQSCILPRDCELTDWSEWSSCSKTCADSSASGGQRGRSRGVLQFPVGGGEECSPLEELEPCEPQGDPVPPCNMYTWRTTEWSDCRVDLLLGQQEWRRSNLTSLCGGGLQTREVFCVQANAGVLQYLTELREKDKASPPVENHLCDAPPPDRSQLCHTPCPVDCEVSSWGAWGPCAFENCDDQAAKKGFKLRKRQVTNEPTGGAGNCPHLVEALPCDEPSCYTWRVLGLDQCVPDEEQQCGVGTQLPESVCVNSNGEEVDRSLCSSVPAPPPVSCSVPCSRDCVLSTWTSWSSCSQTCSSKTSEGKQLRTRSILAYNAGEGGAVCPNSSSLQQVRNCNEHACTVYHWQTGPWGPCSEAPPSSYNTSVSIRPPATPTSCSTGTQTRKVICVRVNVGQVPPKKCPEAPRPSAVRACELPCKKDCIVTPFSDWTPCPVTCDGAGNVVKRKRWRKRLVIQTSSNGGQECPDVLEEEENCEAPPTCPGFRWKTHKWRKCQLVPWFLRDEVPGSQENCGPGLQTRAVSCRRFDGTPADISECLRLARMPPSMLPMPPIAQRCTLPCQDDCQLTNWSKFSSCSADCVGVRTRKRALIGRSKKRDQCKNTQMFPLSETQYCPCDKYNAQPMGNWSDCILAEGGRPEGGVGLRVQGDMMKECGQGYRYQAMVCYDQEERLVETSRCNSHGYIEEACVVPCASDCKLSEWSNWSRCSKSCGSGVKVRSKWLREKPYNGGRPCPKMDRVNQVYEEVPCHSDCNQYVWVDEPWSVWKVSNVDLKENCGEGVQTRRVRCMLNTIEGPSEAVEDYLCDPEDMPLGARESRLPCPEDCVLNDWSSWNRCVLPCTRTMSRVRTAYTLRPPSVGRQCPDATDKEPCSLNLNCFNYFYNITDWSTCQLSANAVCGGGIQTRMLDCVRSDGKSVHVKFCEELNLEKKWQMNMSCVVECPVNCQLSQWSPWSQCSHTCGLEGMGPERVPFLSLTLPLCLLLPLCVCSCSPSGFCLAGPWDPQCGVTESQQLCLHPFLCTHPTQHNVDGSRVHLFVCLFIYFCLFIYLIVCLFVCLLIFVCLFFSLFVCCTGECYMMEWSDWSVCVSLCVKGTSADFGSVRVRSRAVVAQEPENLQLCPDQQWESEPCTGGQCYDYKWLSGSSPTSGRSFFWCQRSDGLNVTGGCPPMNLPGDDSSCDPPCLRPQSFCTEAGVCVCAEGFTEVGYPSGLLRCAPIPVLEVPTARDKKGDVKTSRAVNPTSPSTGGPGRTGRNGRSWYLQPYGPDGKMKMWVYGVAAGALVLLLFIMSMVYLACKKPSRPSRQKQTNRLRPLTLAYDGDADM
uniref:Thrombospondin type-1 domain-containing protein 7A-like n=1 Tax=Gouania willdenowi TaxID=441366 RepID=A0A8C5G0N2_GOUWI